MKTAYIQSGEKVTVTSLIRDLGHSEQTKVFYSDGSEGWEYTADLQYPAEAANKTIEDIARYLLARKVSFEYSDKFLKVTDPEFLIFVSASYHVQSGKLVLMDDVYSEVPVSSVLMLKSTNN